MTAPIVPVPARLIQTGIDRLAGLRPASCVYDSAAGRYVPKKNWSKSFAGWRSQLALVEKRIAEEVAASRLSTSEGAALTQLIASEFDVFASVDPTAAIGTVTLTRTPYGRTAGIIPKGTKFSRKASADTDYVPNESAEYETTESSPYAASTFVRPVQIRATRAGSHANIAWATPAITADVTLPGGFAVSTFDAAGGADGQQDDVLRRMAMSYAAGRYAPVLAAILAGAYQTPGVYRAAAIDDPIGARTIVFVADRSWAWSEALGRLTLSTIHGLDMAGFGCPVVAGEVENIEAHLAVTVIVRDPKYLNNADELTTKIRAAAKAYFDDRPAWWTWDVRALAGKLAGADRRLLHCSASVPLTLTDANGGALVQTALADVWADAVLPHVYLSDSSTEVAFEAPSYA